MTVPFLTPTAQAVPLDGPIPADVIRVYDGDTLTVDAHPWPQVTMRVSVRIHGIDTPELRGKCEDEKAKARLARDRTAALAGEVVELRGVFLGKYAGRVVADVTNTDGIDIAQTLVSEGLARTYDGGTRPGWCGEAGES